VKINQNKAKIFERTALPHLATIYRVARQLSGESEAEDLTQETFLRAWKYFQSFREGTNCRAWLMRILYNVWASRCGRQRLEIPLAGQEENFEPYYDWEGDLLAVELSSKMEGALAQLPINYRWAVLLADVEELTYQQIASVMGCPIGTVMSRLNRGRRALARLLQTGSETTSRAVKKSGAS